MISLQYSRRAAYPSRSVPAAKKLAIRYVRGLKARGNITADIEWKDGKVVNFRLASPHPRPVTVRVNGAVETVLPHKSQ